MFLKTHIRKHEVGLLFHQGDFVRPLGPGTYYAPKWSIKRKIEVIDMLKTRFDHPLIDILVRDGQLADMLLLVDLGSANELKALAENKVGLEVTTSGKRVVLMGGDARPQFVLDAAAAFLL